MCCNCLLLNTRRPCCCSPQSLDCLLEPCVCILRKLVYADSSLRHSLAQHNFLLLTLLRGTFMRQLIKQQLLYTCAFAWGTFSEDNDKSPIGAQCLTMLSCGKLAYDATSISQSLHCSIHSQQQLRRFKNAFILAFYKHNQLFKCSINIFEISTIMMSLSLLQHL